MDRGESSGGGGDRWVLSAGLVEPLPMLISEMEALSSSLVSVA